MKKLKLIYNPFSGDKSFKNSLDDIIDVLQNNGNFEVSLFRITQFGDVDKYISTLNKNDVDVFCISGGDGSINIIINAMKKYNFNVPLGIFPSGTANDFATNLKLPKDFLEVCDTINAGIVKKIDIGKINEQYFINVVCIGLFASISQNVNLDLKNSIGKLAYYVKGAEVFAKFAPITVHITTSVGSFVQKTHLILVMNSSGAGGFNNLAPNSSVSDGKFDLILFKYDDWSSSATTFFKALSGRHVNEDNVLYFQDEYFKIESTDGKNIYPDTDIDGERGPSFPLEIHTIKEGITIFVPLQGNFEK